MHSIRHCTPLALHAPLVHAPHLHLLHCGSTAWPVSLRGTMVSALVWGALCAASASHTQRFAAPTPWAISAAGLGGGNVGTNGGSPNPTTVAELAVLKHIGAGGTRSNLCGVCPLPACALVKPLCMVMYNFAFPRRVGWMNVCCGVVWAVHTSQPEVASITRHAV